MPKLSLGKFNKFYKQYYLEAYKKNIEPTAILISSAPGIGKTESIRQLAKEIAEELGLEFLDTATLRTKSSEELKKYETDEPKAFIFHNVNLSIIEPTDFQGLPSKENGKTVYYPPTWVALMAHQPGILFLDEITNIQRADMFSALHKVVAEKCVGDTRLSKHVHIVSACNPPEVSELANDLPEALVNRFQTIEVEFDKDAWVGYMSRTWPKVPAHIFEYIGSVIAESGIRVTKGVTNYLTPRSVEGFIKSCEIMGIDFRNVHNNETRKHVEFLAESFFGADKDKCSKIIHYLTVSGEILNALNNGDFNTVKEKYENGLDDFDKLIVPVMLASYLPQTAEDYEKIFNNKKVYETYKGFAELVCKTSTQNTSNLVYSVFTRELHDEKFKFQDWDDFKKFIAKTYIVGSILSGVLNNGLDYENTKKELEKINKMSNKEISKYINFSTFNKNVIEKIANKNVAGNNAKIISNVMGTIYNNLVNKDKLDKLIATDEGIEALLDSIEQNDGMSK